jgi:hypothetical protein
MMAAFPQLSRRDLAALFLVLVVGVAVKTLVIRGTPVMARDGIGFVEFAQRLRQEPLGDVLRTTVQHPLYPMHIAAGASLWEWATTEPLTPTTWQVIAQVANAWAGVAVAVPIFLLARRIGGTGTAFAAAVLSQVLPVAARNMGDALSEGTYLLLAWWTLWFAVVAIERRQAGWFLAAGIFSGLAFLTRPEGAGLVLAAALAVLVFLRRQAVTPRWAVASGLAMGLACLAVVGPYWWTLGRLTSKNTANHMLRVETTRPMVHWLPASRFTPGVDGVNYDDVTTAYALGEAAQEVGKSFLYVLWLPALVGMAVSLGQRTEEATRPRGAAVTVLLAAAAVNALVLAWLAVKAHYVSERHTLMLLMVGLCFLVPGLQRILQAMVTRWRGWTKNAATQAAAFPPRLGWVVHAVLVFVALVGLQRTLRPMHAHRVGHKEAGEWYASHHAPSDRLIDPYGWASYYAGLRFIRVDPPVQPHHAPGAQFIVTEPGEVDRYRLQVITSAQPKNAKVEPVLHWPSSGPPKVILLKVLPTTRTATARSQ